MPRDGSGTYSQPANTSAVNGATIDPDKFNTLISDISSALTTSVNTAGTKAMAGDLQMAGSKITGMAAGAATTDAANMGNVHPTVLAKTANYTVLTTDTGRLITGDATSASFTLTLPAAASSSGMVIGAKKIDASANTVTLDGNGAETIEGSLTFVLSAQYDSVIIVCNGTAWYVIPSVPATIANLTITTAAITTGTIGTAILSGTIRHTGVITPTALAADTNDYAPTSASSNSVWRISASSAVKITGIAALTSGTEIQLVNAGSNSITLTANDAASSAANRLDLPGGSLVLRPLDGIKFRYDGTLSLWVAIAVPYTSHPVAGGFKNLAVQATGNTAATITADAITLEDANGFTFRALSVSITITATAQGANGIGNASALSTATWYFAWVIYNPTTNTVAGIVDVSATAPTMPSGYTFKARVGAVITDGSAHFKRTLQYGRKAAYIIGTNPTTMVTMQSGASGVIGTTGANTWTSAAVAAFVPSTATEIHVYISNDVSASGPAQVIAAPNNTYKGYQSNIPPPLMIDNAGIPVRTSSQAVFILEGANIFYASSNPGGLLACLGWVDNI